MALKEIFHVVATELPVGTDTAATLPSGRIVVLNATGNVDLPDLHADVPIGIAGDTISTNFSATVRNPESAGLVIGSWATETTGNTRWTQNRVADNYNETLASALITVYNGGGEFWTDQYGTVTEGGAANTWTVGNAVYADVAAGTTTAGHVTPDATNKVWSVGVLVGGPQALPSGVPGTDVQGSISFGTFIRFILMINHIA